MADKKKTLILSAAGLAVLIALTVILAVVQRESVPDDKLVSEPEPDTRVQFTNFEPADVVSISVNNEHGEYNIVRTGDTLAVPELFTAPLNVSRLHISARNMAGFWAREIVDENVEPLYQYGLEETAARAFVTFAGGETLEIFVGDKTPTAEDMTYVRVMRTGSKDTVYAVFSYLVDWLRESPLTYISTEVTISFTDAGWPLIDRFVIDRAGHEQYIIELIPRLDEEEIVINSHRLTAPLEVEVDKGERITQGLFGLTAERVEYAGEDIHEKYAHIFEEPDLVAVMTIGDYTASLTVKDFYGFHSGSPDVLYVFSAQSLHYLLSFDTESIMATMFHRPYIFTVAEFIVETPLHTLPFTFTGYERANEKYFLDGEPVDTNRFKDLYIFALSASAEGLFKGEPEDVADMPLLARYTYIYRDTDIPDAVIEFFDSGDLRAVIAVNGEPRFTTRIGYLTRLAQNLEAYLNDEPLINSW